MHREKKHMWVMNKENTYLINHSSGTKSSDCWFNYSLKEARKLSNIYVGFCVMKWVCRAMFVSVCKEKEPVLFVFVIRFFPPHTRWRALVLYSFHTE